MLLHSCIYYVFDDSLVDDNVWQKWANELRDLQVEYGSEIGYYDKEFADWDGSSGVFLPLKEEWVLRKARQLLAYKDKCFVR